MTGAAVGAPRRRPSATESTEGAAVAERFEANLGLADRLAWRYTNGAAIDDDLRQVAHLGLLLASRRFDPDKGRFLRFASVTIIGELKKHLRSHGWSVHVARSLQEDSITVAAATGRLTGELGRHPRVQELADATAMSIERVAEAVRVHDVRFRVTHDPVAHDVAAADDTPERALLDVALGELDDGERRLVARRYDDGWTQQEIADELGVSQSEAHRRIGTALRRLRHDLVDADEGRGSP